MNSENDSKALLIQRHGIATRLAHMGLALAVLLQIATSLVMTAPKIGQPEDFFFEVHEYSGLAALGFALAFWIVMLVRRGGTDMGALFPWFSTARREAFKNDLRLHGKSVRTLSFPRYREDGPLASATHGLGLMLMSGMASTGAIWFAADLLGFADTTVIGLLIEVHKLMSNLVWAYLFGHAGMALLHHFRHDASLKKMWPGDDG